MICPICQSDNRDTAKFCDNCGMVLPRICPNCGIENRSGAKFCDNCGFDLNSGAADSGRRTVDGGRWTVDDGRRTVDDGRRTMDDGASTGSASVLNQLVPPELAGKLEAARRRGTMEGERRVVTMLFCDVVGSTAASERLDPEEWTDIMNAAFESMIKPIYRYEGTVARLMGDAILAFFGAPIAHEDDPQRAVLAGLTIVQGIQQFRQDVHNDWGIDLNVRVGINTGLVVVGAVGSDLRLEYTAMGDAINLAARMEQTAEPGTVQIAEDTYHLVAPLFEFEALGGIKVKGKGEPVPSYRILGRKVATEKLRGIEGLDAPLIGRSSEWERLEEVLGKLDKGVGGIVCLVGEAGLGKSRLIKELKATVENRSPACAWHDTASLSYETNQPYAMFQRLVRRMVGSSNSDPVDLLREKLETAVADIPDEEAADVRPVFASLFSMADPTGQAPLAGEAFKGRLFTVMERLWRQRASRQPLVLVFDDLHWSDPASVDLLLHLLPLTEQNPLLILGAMRPEPLAPGWQMKLAAETKYSYRYSEIALHPLTQADSGDLVDSLLAISDLPLQLRARILEKAEGNPFFVEEVVRTLIDSGAVVQDETGRKWHATGAGEAIEIPGNVQALLTARIDRLEAEARGTLQLAAVIGRNFYYRVLSTIIDKIADLDDQLLALLRTQMILETSRLPELEYIFRHALTQEAAYSTILLRQRRIFHGRVGEALESLFPDQYEELAGSLARHFYLAREYERALHYYTLAGDVAFRQFATEEAVESFSKAIACTEKVDQMSSEQLIHLYSRRGRAYELSNQFNEALDNYRRMVKLAQDRDDKALLLSSLTSQCIIHASQSPLYDPPKAKTLGEEALQLAEELGDRAAEAKVLWALMLTIIHGGGDSQQALAYGQESLTISRELGLTEQMGYTLHNLANVYQSQDRFEESLQSALDARAVWVALNNTPMLADSYFATSTVYLFRGDYETTIADAQEILRLGQSIGNTWTQIVAYFYSGPSYIEKGEFGRAFEHLHRGLDLAVEEGITPYQDIAKSNLLYLYLWSGAYDLAQPLIEELYRKREQLIFGFSFIILSRIAMLKIARDDFQQAEQIIVEAQLGLDKETSTIMFVAPYLMAKATLRMAQSRAEEALEVAQEVAEKARQSGMHHFLPEALLIQGQAFGAMDKLNQAGDVLQDARSVATEIGQRRVLWQILAALAEIEERQGNSSKARTYRHEARKVIDTIAEHCGSQLRPSFLSMPAVQAVLQVSGTSEVPGS